MKTTKQVRLHEGAFDVSLKEALRNYEEHSVPSDSREEEQDDEASLGGGQDPRGGDDSSQDYDIAEDEGASYKATPKGKTVQIDSKGLGQHQGRVKPA